MNENVNKVLSEARLAVVQTDTSEISPSSFSPPMGEFWSFHSN